MNPRRLRYFIAVVEYGGQVRAAAKLRISQPSLSQAMSHLERDLGVALFEKLGRGVALSEAGRAFLPAARRAVHALDVARDPVDALRGLSEGTLRVIALPSLSLLPLPDLLSRFHQKYPGIRLVCGVGFDSEQLVEAVMSASADVAFGIDLPECPGARRFCLGYQELSLALPPGTDAPKKEATTEEVLHSLPVIAGAPGTRTRYVLDSMIARGAQLNIAAEVANREMMIPLVRQGIGCGFVAPAYAEVAVEAGLTVVGLNPRVPLRIDMLLRTDHLSPATNAFLQIAQAEG